MARTVKSIFSWGFFVSPRDFITWFRHRSFPSSRFLSGTPETGVCARCPIKSSKDVDVNIVYIYIHTIYIYMMI